MNEVEVVDILLTLGFGKECKEIICKKLHFYFGFVTSGSQN